MTLVKNYFDTNINHELHGYFSWCHRCSNDKFIIYDIQSILRCLFFITNI